MSRKSLEFISELLSVSVDARGVATVMMTNAEKHNAFDDKIIKQLTDIFHRLDASADVRVVILGGTGKSFSAGADLNWMKRMADYSYEENLRDSRALAQLMKTLDNLRQPTIARVHGAAFGGAVGLVSCCDFAVSTERASFCLSEVKVGLIPATIGPYVVAAIGSRAARRYFLSAERFSAEQACNLGLITSVVNETQIDGEIDVLAEQLLRNSPQAMQQAKTLVATLAREPLNDAQIEKTCEMIAGIRVSAEGQEGLQAFLEKRQATWQKRSD